MNKHISRKKRHESDVDGGEEVMRMRCKSGRGARPRGAGLGRGRRLSTQQHGRCLIGHIKGGIFASCSLHISEIDLLDRIIHSRDFLEVMCILQTR